MDFKEKFSSEIFKTDNDQSFERLAIELFNYQYENNQVYKNYVDILKIDKKNIRNINQIPFLPIEFYKTHKIIIGNNPIQQVFYSSGTSSENRSKHFVTDIQLYEETFKKVFQLFYGDIKDYCILGLLPSYLEQGNSSLVYMIDELIKNTECSDSGFYLKNVFELIDKINYLNDYSDRKILLLGVSFALLDLIDIFTFDCPNIIVMETGGMKGRRSEITRKELHESLSKGFNVEKIHSEYGMTELFSQAYSKGNGIFKTPNWMKVLIRDVNDPMNVTNHKATGAVNIIDLANINSCAFIATQDLGRLNEDGSFEILGRIDNSDLRGCNLMV